MNTDQEWKAGLREEVIKAELGQGQCEQEGRFKRRSEADPKSVVIDGCV